MASVAGRIASGASFKFFSRSVGPYLNLDVQNKKFIIEKETIASAILSRAVSHAFRKEKTTTFSHLM